MSIVARILMLVACGPLLQPTGFCICKADGHVRPPTTQRSFAAGEQFPTLVRKTRCCSKCHSPKSAATSTTGQSVPHQCPTPNDDSHMPGCPASAGADALKWIEPAPVLADLLPAGDVISLPLTEVVTAVPRLTDLPAARSPSPPLYLSHCSLVI